ncbi:MAG: alpha/beta hydrolase [Lachnospiraceae bacterium]|nr:alpha/beta hydrolase [Lachnospiraceae bacterium]
MIGLFMMHFVSHPKRSTYEETRQREISRNHWGNYDDIPKEEWNITSFDGSLLHGYFLPNNSNRYVIITHGYTDTHHGSVKYANIYYSLGYNVYLYDIRYHGVNEHKKNYCTMGDAESKDLSAVIAAHYQRFGKDIFLGIHGESLGAASSILSLEYNQQLNFCVADCPFYDLKELLYYQAMQMFHMPKPMVHLANMWYRILKHRNFFKISPVKVIAQNHVPFLLIHGGDDDFIPTYHSYKLFEACPSSCNKTLHIMPGANHAESYKVNTKLYQQWIEEFLDTLS